MTAVPVTPEPKTIEQTSEAFQAPEARLTMRIGDGPEIPLDTRSDEQGVETIRQYAGDLEDLATKEKAANQVLEDLEKDWDETKEVQRLEAELETAREQLKSRRHGNTSYLAQTEVVAKVKRDRAEAKEILSRYLIFHFRKTGEQQVLMDENNGDAREVILTGKLGRKTKYQTSLALEPAE